jgi:hypothetical protein
LYKQLAGAVEFKAPKRQNKEGKKVQCSTWLRWWSKEGRKSVARDNKWTMEDGSAELNIAARMDTSGMNGGNLGRRAFRLDAHTIRHRFVMGQHVFAQTFASFKFLIAIVVVAAIFALIRVH